MAFETREQVLEKMLSQEKPQCPHCGTDMNIWETPPMNFSDGLGWEAKQIDVMDALCLSQTFADRILLLNFPIPSVWSVSMSRANCPVFPQ